MQKPEKSCSPCRARKTKCDLKFPRCSSCQMRDLVCQFETRRKPGPSKGSKKQGAPKRYSQRSNTGSTESSNPDPAGIWQTSPDNFATSQPELIGLAENTVANETATGPRTSDMLLVLKQPLANAYITMKLFPFLPRLSQQQLFDAEEQGSLGVALVNAACAISAHSAASDVFDNLLISQNEVAEAYAVLARSAYLQYTREEEHPTNLTIIKVAALLAMYEMSCSPGIKGWSMVGEAVRLAYDMRLDQLDSGSYMTSAFMTPDDAQDARYLWWSVYSLDTYVSTTLMRPFAITSDNIRVSLVLSPEYTFESDNVSGTSLSFLPADLPGLQMVTLALNHHSSASTETLYLLVLFFMRLLANMRRRQFDGEMFDFPSELIQNTLATFQLSIPDSFRAFRGSSEDRHLRLTRIEIVLLLEMQTLVLDTQATFPDTLQQSSPTNILWDSSPQIHFNGYPGKGPSAYTHSDGKDIYIENALTIGKIVRNLSPQDFPQLSPTVASVLWLPAVALGLHQKSNISKAEQANAASGFHVLKAALNRMGTTWAVAQVFHDALTSFYSQLNLVPTDISARYIMQSYSSPLISVSCGKNSVQIPCLVLPSFDMTT